jgi:hypothetical protein
VSSFLWYLQAPVNQLPIFLLWPAYIRRWSTISMAVSAIRSYCASDCSIILPPARLPALARYHQYRDRRSDRQDCS